MLYPDAKIIVFAKTPIAGKVKTRLIPALGEQGAKQLHCQMLQHTLNTLTTRPLASVELHCAPTINDKQLKQLAKDHQLELHQQQGADLGERMAYALQQTLYTQQSAILIGTDCPAIDIDYIQQAIEELDNGHDIVIGPAEDGGYVLIGVKLFNSELFKDIDWGSGRVLQQTKHKIDQLDLSLKELDTLWDIDNPHDLRRLKQNRQLADRLLV